MKFLVRLAKEVFDSGKAIGFKSNITEATGWLRTHSKGLGEELGNALSGKAKKANDFLIKSDMYDKLFAHLDEVAKQYPDATVQVAAKNARKGGFKIGKISVKNGDKTIYEQAVSIANDGTVKSKANGMGTRACEYVDREGVRFVASSDVGTVRTSYNFGKKAGELELKHGGEQVAIAKYSYNNGNMTRGGVTYEVADDLVSGQMCYNNHEVSFLGSNEGLKQWGTRYKTEIQKQKEKVEPLVLELLRPLRERFNDVIDMFKYNGRRDYERLVSKQELSQSVKELQDEAVNLEKIIKSSEKVSDAHVDYLRQIKTDIDYGKQLIEISV